MKNALTCLFVALALPLSQAAFAQLRVGLKAGVNAATLRIPDQESSVSLKPRVDFQGGLLIDMAISKHFSLQPAVLLSIKGTQVDALLINGNTGSTISPIHNSIKLVYTEIPVLALFKTSLSPSCRLYGGLGPYWGIGLGGRVSSTLASLAEREVNFGSGAPSSNTYRRIDYGLSGAAGLEWHRLLLGLNYNYGVVDLGSATNKAYNRNLGITLGFWLSRPSL